LSLARQEYNWMKAMLSPHKRSQRGKEQVTSIPSHRKHHVVPDAQLSGTTPAANVRGSQARRFNSG
jgi:hypothetical protein